MLVTIIEHPSDEKFVKILEQEKKRSKSKRDYSNRKNSKGILKKSKSKEKSKTKQGSLESRPPKTFNSYLRVEPKKRARKKREVSKNVKPKVKSFWKQRRSRTKSRKIKTNRRSSKSNSRMKRQSSSPKKVNLKMKGKKKSSKGELYSIF